MIENKIKNIIKLDKINEILFDRNISAENLENHKKIIQELLQKIEDKGEKNYILQSEKEILEKELNFWVYDFENLKLNTNIREKLRDLDINLIINNINEEMSHKK